MANPILMNWGIISFQVWPFNYQEYQHSTATDWARKEIVGAAIYREWVGELEEEITIRGKVFPRFFAAYNAGSISGKTFAAGGMGYLDTMDNMRRLGQAHALVRGDGWHFGWFVIERLQRGHTHIDVHGYGQQIDFEAVFQRVPVPVDPSAYFSSLWDQPK